MIWPVRIFVAVLLLLLLAGCMKRIPVDPAQQATFEQQRGNLRLAFTTSHGRQVAYYLPPLTNPDQAPSRLCLLYPGITAQALG